MTVELVEITAIKTRTLFEVHFNPGWKELEIRVVVVVVVVAPANQHFRFVQTCVFVNFFLFLSLCLFIITYISNV